MLRNFDQQEKVNGLAQNFFYKIMMPEKYAHAQYVYL
jgi:hypothetical protein